MAGPALAEIEIKLNPGETRQVGTMRVTGRPDGRLNVEELTGFSGGRVTRMVPQGRPAEHGTFTIGGPGIEEAVTFVYDALELPPPPALAKGVELRKAPDGTLYQYSDNLTSRT